MFRKISLEVAATSLLVVANASAQATTTVGAFSVEPPTLLSIGVDWKISGDDNRNARPEGLDFRLKPGAKAMDAGQVLLSITDEFTGKAPDIGAYEIGRPMPQYGPRN